PRRFLAQSADELRLLKAAARLRGVRPGADRPDPAFLADLRRQLASAEGGGRTADGFSSPSSSAVRLPLSAGVTRRHLLARLGAAFAAAGRMKYGPASYRDPLPPLPAIETRVEGGQVYVWTV